MLFSFSLLQSQQKCIVIFALVCCFAVLVALIFSAVDIWGEDEDGITEENCSRDCRWELQIYKHTSHCQWFPMCLPCDSSLQVLASADVQTKISPVLKQRRGLRWWVGVASSTSEMWKLNQEVNLSNRSVNMKASQMWKHFTAIYFTHVTNVLLYVLFCVHFWTFSYWLIPPASIVRNSHCFSSTSNHKTITSVTHWHKIYTAV